MYEGYKGNTFCSTKCVMYHSCIVLGWNQLKEQRQGVWKYPDVPVVCAFRSPYSCVFVGCGDTDVHPGKVTSSPETMPHNFHSPEFNLFSRSGRARLNPVIEFLKETTVWTQTAVREKHFEISSIKCPSIFKGLLLTAGASSRTSKAQIAECGADPKCQKVKEVCSVATRWYNICTQRPLHKMTAALMNLFPNQLI